MPPLRPGTILAPAYSVGILTSKSWLDTQVPPLPSLNYVAANHSWVRPIPKSRGSQVARLAFGSAATRHNERGASPCSRHSLLFCSSRVAPEIDVLNYFRNQTFPCSLQIEPSRLTKYDPDGFATVGPDSGNIRRAEVSAPN
jgi:hypothetical protein